MSFAADHKSSGERERGIIHHYSSTDGRVWTRVGSAGTQRYMDFFFVLFLLPLNLVNRQKKKKVGGSLKLWALGGSAVISTMCVCAHACICMLCVHA